MEKQNEIKCPAVDVFLQYVKSQIDILCSYDNYNEEQLRAIIVIKNIFDNL